MSESDVGGSYRDENPYSVPLIECGKCGTTHHIDATTLEEQGRCRHCLGFLRRPTQEEIDQFTDYYVWNCERMERELHTDNDSEATDGD